MIGGPDGRPGRVGNDQSRQHLGRDLFSHTDQRRGVAGVAGSGVV